MVMSETKSVEHMKAVCYRLPDFFNLPYNCKSSEVDAGGLLPICCSAGRQETVTAEE